MDLAGIIHDLFFDYTLRTIALGSAIIGLVSGSLGCYAVLRRQSLLGDAMSHAALPGIVAAFILTGSKAPLVLVLGAAAAGWLATLKIIGIVRLTRLKYDAAMALILSVFFGLGLVLLTYVQRQPNASQAGLETFLFGQAAALLARDVIVMAILACVALAFVVVFWNQFKLLSFDPDFGKSLGLPISFLDVLLTSLLVIAIIIGLQTVGVVLMSAMVVAPAASARQWTDRLGGMVFLAAVFGALAGVSGAVISSSMAHMPTGPTIIVCLSLIVAVSLTLAPNRGLLWRWAGRRRSHRRLRLESVLADLYAMAMQHGDYQHAHEIGALNAVSSVPGGVEAGLRALENQGLVSQPSAGRWRLTPAGMDKVKEIIRGMEPREL